MLVLGEQTLSAAQVTLITNWGTAGGSLIALRPAANLQSLLGLNAAQGTQAHGHIRVNDTQAPGTGITAETMQHHGVAKSVIYTRQGNPAWQGQNFAPGPLRFSADEA